MQVSEDLTIEDDNGIESPVINIIPDVEYQEIEGFGGAFTEAASTTVDKPSRKNRDKKSLIPMITDALKYGDIDMLMSPWSPPAYMKTNGEINHGGKLKEEYFELWSQFYVKFIEAYKKRRRHWLYHGTE